MFKKKLTYIILLIVFSLVLCGDLAIYFAVPEIGGNGLGNFSMEALEDFANGDFNPEDFAGGDFNPEDAIEDSAGEPSPENAASESTSGEAGIENSANNSTSGNATSPEDPTGDTSEDSGQEDTQSGDISSQQPEGERESAQIPEIPDGAGLENGGFLPGQDMPAGGFLSFVKSAFWPILIVCVLVDGWSIFMLIRLKKRAKQGDVSQKTNQTDGKSEGSKKPSKKFWVILLVVVVTIAILIATLPTNQGSPSGNMAAEESVVSETAQRGEIVSSFYGSGTLVDAAGKDVAILDSIEVTGYVVKNGDVVSEGDPIATVDTASVMEAIAQVQEEMNQLDEKIEETSTEGASSTVEAPSSGRVKMIYAQEGTSVLDTMYEHSALMLISLDGCMAVDVESEVQCQVGESVMISLSDGSQEEGKIVQVDDGAIKITLTDDGPEYGETVSVYKENGAQIGSGQLYINSELKVTSVSGTVSEIHVSEGSSISSGEKLLTLTDVGETGEYHQLLQERQELTELMEQLSRMYQDGYVHAESAGIVSGISSDGNTQESVSEGEQTSALASGNASGTQTMALTLLSSTAETETTTDEEIGTDMQEDPSASSESSSTSEGITPSESQETLKYAGQVVNVSYGAIKLRITSSPVGELDYATLAGLDTSLFTVEAKYSPDSSTEVYVYENGASQKGSIEDIKTGDIVLLSLQGEDVVRIDYIPQQSESAQTPDKQEETAPPSVQVPQMQGGDMQIPSRGNEGAADIGETEEESYSIQKQTLCSITPNDTMSVSIRVDELDVLSLAIGQQAVITLDAVSGQSFEGEITSIDPSGINEGGSTKYTVELELERTENMLGGMNASVQITTNQTENVVVIPAAAIYEEGNEVYVYTSYDEKTDTLSDPVEVTTGVSDGTNVEILDGLEEGSSFYYRYGESLIYSFG